MDCTDYADINPCNPRKLWLIPSHITQEALRLVWVKKLLSWQKRFCFRRIKSFFRKKDFVLAGQNLFCPKKVLFASDETFSGQTRSFSEERGQEWPTNILFSPERVSFGTDVTFFGSKRFRFFVNRLRLARQIFGYGSRLLDDMHVVFKDDRGF